MEKVHLSNFAAMVQREVWVALISSLWIPLTVGGTPLDLSSQHFCPVKRSVLAEGCVQTVTFQYGYFVLFAGWFVCPPRNFPYPDTGDVRVLTVRLTVFLSGFVTPAQSF